MATRSLVSGATTRAVTATRLKRPWSPCGGLPVMTRKRKQSFRGWYTMPKHDDRTPGYDEPRPFAEVIQDTRPLTIAEWDDLLASEQNATAEPFEGRTWH